MSEKTAFELPRAEVHYFAFREAADLGWRMVMFEGNLTALRGGLAASGVTPSDLREVMTVFMKDPPDGLHELTGPDLWTGTGHDWVFDAAIERWRAPDEALTPLPGAPERVEVVSFDLDLPRIGWMPVTIAAGRQSVTVQASTVFDPFPELVRWLEALAEGAAPRLLINTEGVNVTFHVFEPEGDMVRFVVTNDAEADDGIDLDILVDRRVLVSGVYEPLISFWEGEGLAAVWRAEWRYDDDPSADPHSETNLPYPVRSADLDRWLRSS